jgi:hypothetical protein
LSRILSVVAVVLVAAALVLSLYTRGRGFRSPEATPFVVVETEDGTGTADATDDIGNMIDRLLIEQPSEGTASDTTLTEDTASEAALTENAAATDEAETVEPAAAGDGTEENSEEAQAEEEKPEEAQAEEEKPEEVVAPQEPLSDEAGTPLKKDLTSDRTSVAAEPSEQAREEDAKVATPTFAPAISDEDDTRATTPQKTALLAVVIDDMGINQPRTREMITLKAPLTSSFLTYGKNLEELAQAARQAGHELMIHVPMEPQGPASLAPDTLMTAMSNDEIAERFDVMLEKFKNLPIRGVNNHMGSKLTTDSEKLNVVIKALEGKNLFFMDSKTIASSVAGKVAKQDGVPFIARDVFLDNVNELAAVKKQLKAAEKTALKKGWAVAIGHPKSQTYQALKEWIENHDPKIELVHVSRIVDLLNAKAPQNDAR